MHSCIVAAFRAPLILFYAPATRRRTWNWQSGGNAIGVSYVAREHGIGNIATVNILLYFYWVLPSLTEWFTLLSLTESYRVLPSLTLLSLTL